jgi:hypothetical protein
MKIMVFGFQQRLNSKFPFSGFPFFSCFRRSGDARLGHGLWHRLSSFSDDVEILKLIVNSETAVTLRLGIPSLVDMLGRRWRGGGT